MLYKPKPHRFKVCIRQYIYLFIYLTIRLPPKVEGQPEKKRHWAYYIRATHLQTNSKLFKYTEMARIS